MQITPLRWWVGFPVDEEGDIDIMGQFGKRYGQRAYVTADSQFSIRFIEDGWHIEPYMIPAAYRQQLAQHGLFDTAFARRRDAVEALEETTAAEGL